MAVLLDELHVSRRKFTVDDYHKMAEAGILTEDDRVELLDGEIVEMRPIGPRHQGRTDRLNALFTARCGEHAIVRVQGLIRLGRRSEPEPDLALLRPRPDFYTPGHPRPGDVLLVVEIADTSAALDRQVKLGLYARAKVREVWLLVISRDRRQHAYSDGASPVLEVYRRPAGGIYTEIRLVRAGEKIVPEALSEIEFSADELLAE